LKKVKNIVRVSFNENSANFTGLVNFTTSIVVCGDPHGQYDDFTEVTGMPSKTNRFFFNGDIVDRGEKAVEIFTLLLTIQGLDEEAITILRGNHETKHCTSFYEFEDEIQDKYNDHEVYKLFLELFQGLPIAATISNRVFVVHGGLGETTYNLTVRKFNALKRKTVDIKGTVVGDFLWSDPRDDVELFDYNSGRRCGYYFGEEATKMFLKKNKLSLLIRSHQVCKEGYKMHHDEHCLTVFSAPSYCGGSNKAAVVKFAVAANRQQSAAITTTLLLLRTQQEKSQTKN
jgi:diadenosine tetraphosphatase ApaH/serine/threonine PP2A family protein phosphatase